MFFVNIEKFLKTSIYIKEHLRTAASESFTWLFTRTNNIGSEKDVFLKIKQNKKLSYMKKTCLFITFFIISFFSFSPLHVRRRLPYVIKDDTSKSLKQLNQWAINLGPMEKLCYLFTYAVHFVLITWIFEPGSGNSLTNEQLILDQWKNYVPYSHMHIVICIVVTNTKFVAHRCI